MKKNVVQDVIPPRKSIRNVELPSKSRGLAEKNLEEKKKYDEPLKIDSKIEADVPSVPSYKYEYDKPKKSPKGGLYIASSVLVLVGAFGISAFFRSAEISVSPKQEVRVLNSTFNAKKDTVANGLGFQVVTISKDLEKVLNTNDLTSEEQVSKKAQGKIIIYNNYSSAPQNLVATTRFQTPEGLIFRLTDSVTIPGQTTKDGKIVAGSVEVTVEADKPGDTYNIKLVDFTIPGFKGDPKYTKIYARSKTEMTGGYSGMQKVVSKEILDKTESELEASLRDSLSKDIITQIPADFILYKNSLSYKFDKTEQITVQVTSTTGTTLLKKKGMASAIIFDRGSLTRAILFKVLPDVSDSMVKIINLPKLNFDYVAPSSGLNTGSDVSFILKGDVDLVWIFDEDKLKSDLLGLSKKNAKIILATYATIKEAWVKTRPFWNQTIPNDPNKVTLVNTVSSKN